MNGTYTKAAIYSKVRKVPFSITGHNLPISHGTLLSWEGESVLLVDCCRWHPHTHVEIPELQKRMFTLHLRRYMADMEEDGTLGDMLPCTHRNNA